MSEPVKEIRPDELRVGEEVFIKGEYDDDFRIKAVIKGKSETWYALENPYTEELVWGVEKPDLFQRKDLKRAVMTTEGHYIPEDQVYSEESLEGRNPEMLP